jgi:hypothetical protein
MKLPSELWQIIVQNLSLGKQLSLIKIDRSLYGKIQTDKLKLNENTIPKLKCFLELKNLYIAQNKKIVDINHLQKLRKINIPVTCGVNQKGLEFLRQIDDINCGNNKKITCNGTKIIHLQKLRKIDISWRCGVKT